MKYLIQAGLSIGVVSLLHATPLFACDVTYPAQPEPGVVKPSSELQQLIDNNPDKRICLQPGTIVETGGQSNSPLVITQNTTLIGLPGEIPRIQNSSGGNGYEMWYTAVRHLASTLTLNNIHVSNKSSVAALLVDGGNLLANGLQAESSGSGGKAIEFRTAGAPSVLRNAIISCSGTDCRGVKASHYSQVKVKRSLFEAHGDSSQAVQLLDHSSFDAKRLKLEVKGPHAKGVTVQMNSVANLENLLIGLDRSFTRGIMTIGDGALQTLRNVYIRTPESITQPIGLVHQSRVAIPEVDGFRFDARGSDGGRAMFLQGNSSSLYNSAFDAVIGKVNNAGVLLDSATAVAFAFNALPGGNPSANGTGFILEMQDTVVVATAQPTLYNFSDDPSQIIIKTNVTFNGEPVS